MHVIVSRKATPVEVATLAEASRVVSDYTRGKRSSVFYSALPTGAHGAPIFVGDVQVAHVSFNGRVWEGNVPFPQAKEILP
jgi:hypothetical protein